MSCSFTCKLCVEKVLGTVIYTHCISLTKEFIGKILYFVVAIGTYV